MVDDKHKRPMMYAAVAWTMAVMCSMPQVLTFANKRYEFKSRNSSNPRTIVLYHCSATINEQESVAYVFYFSSVAWLVPTCLASYFYGYVMHASGRARTEKTR